MSRNVARNVIAFLSGVLFAVGLAFSGMTQPAKVIGFLDFFGSWDPSLMFVMGGAIMVYLPLARLVQRRAAPLLDDVFRLPTRREIEPRLLVGAGLFGIGWGIAGYCPGPGIASVGSGSAAALVFVLAMATGMAAFHALEALARQRADAHDVVPDEEAAA